VDSATGSDDLNSSMSKEQGQGVNQVYDSPHLLIPLVEAFEHMCALDPVNAAAIGEAIGKVVLVLVPGQRLIGSLELHADETSPVVAPSAAGVPGIKGGVLMYSGCFEVGSKGCFTKQDVINFLEYSALVFGQNFVLRIRSDHTPACLKPT
jgi:hypothetical protein